MVVVMAAKGYPGSYPKDTPINKVIAMAMFHSCAQILLTLKLISVKGDLRESVDCDTFHYRRMLGTLTVKQTKESRT